jgi:hypothetical protein
MDLDLNVCTPFSLLIKVNMGGGISLISCSGFRGLSFWPVHFIYTFLFYGVFFFVLFPFLLRGGMFSLFDLCRKYLWHVLSLLWAGRGISCTIYKLSF